MNPPDLNDGQWRITVRSGGEILTAAAAEPSIELGLLGIPSGYTPAEIEGWLHDLIGVARETGREDSKPRPIPALLHHGLTGLLFSHAQLWNRDDERHPASYAIVHGDGVVAFGWIGDASLVTRVAGAAADPGEIIVRDEEGREARAFELPDTHLVDLRLEWPAGAPGDAQVVLEAHWSGAAATREAAAPTEAAGGARDAAFDAALEAAGASAFAPTMSEAPALRDEIEVPPAPHPFTAAVPEAPEPREDVETLPASDPLPDAAGADPFASATPEAPALRDEIEAPLAPHPAPDVSVAPMEDIVRDAYPAYASPVPSYLEPSGEPLDLGAPAPPAVDLPREEWQGTETFVTPAAPRVTSPSAEAFAPPEMTPATTPGSEAFAPAPAATSAAAPVEAAPHGASPAARMVDPGEPTGPAPPEGAQEPRAALSAGQASPGTALETLDETPASSAAHPPAVETFAPEEEEEPRPSRLRRLFSRLGLRRRGDPGAPTGAGADLPAGATDASAFGAAREPAAHDVPGVPEQVPPTPEPAALTARAVHPDAAPVHADAARQIGEDVLIGDATTAAADDGPARAAASAGALPPQGGTPRTPLRPQWPAAEEFVPPAPLWKRPWAWGVLLAALFAGGWIIGHMNDESRSGAARGVRNVLRTVGLGGAHFEVMVNSRPPGAWISVNGEDLARRTPASIELKPGEHDVTLSFSDLGAATFKVRGADGDRLALDPPLWGSIRIYSSDEAVPVAVAVDGIARGFAPLRVDSLQPGAHEIRFSGPGLPSWGQTVQVRVNESADLIARPMTSPATGVIEVRASMSTETGTVEVEGARVWLDSEPAGQTPLTLELPRGPHSIRVEHVGETAPVQVIDLPGGNQRFATFVLRPGADLPTLAPLDPPGVVRLDRPTVVSMVLDGVPSTDVREMWLHVQTPDGPWRRYEMAWLKSPHGVVGVALFPTTLFGADGRVHYYASATTQGGDEYFSEVRVAARPDAKPAAARTR